MKHIGIFNTSGDVQTALSQEDLLNPYVAMVSGALDYNTQEPACIVGEWSYDAGNDAYTFDLDNLSCCPNYDPEVEPLVIATIPGYVEGAQVNATLAIGQDQEGLFLQIAAVGISTNYVTRVPALGLVFDVGGIILDNPGAGSDAAKLLCTANYSSGGYLTFTFTMLDSSGTATFVMNTINPACPE